MQAAFAQVPRRRANLEKKISEFASRVGGRQHYHATEPLRRVSGKKRTRHQASERVRDDVQRSLKVALEVRHKRSKPACDLW